MSINIEYPVTLPTFGLAGCYYFMSQEQLILEPLIDAPVGNGYRPDFSMPDRAAEDLQLQAWAKDLLCKADSEGYALVPYVEMLKSMGKIVGYDYVFLKEDPWRVRDTLFRAGLGAAPDSMIEKFSLKGRDNVVLYQANQEVPTIRTRQYKKALILVKFATLMLPDLDASELAHTGLLIDEWIKTPRYRKHLRGVLRWYNQRRRLLDARTKRVFSTIMESNDCKLLSQQLLALAAMRGANLSAKSIFQLDRMLVLCGHGEGDVHSLLHRIQCGGMALQEHYGGTEALAQTWDSTNLSIVERETAAVQSLLSSVFEQDIEEEGQAVSTSKEPSDNDLTTLMRQILSREEWPLSELDKICATSGKSAAVVLEEINDKAIEIVGDTAIDIDGDKAYVTTAYSNQLFSP